MPELYGLTDKGFKAKDFSTIEQELQNGLRKEVDATLKFGSDSVAGIITAIVAVQARQVWESLSGLFHSLQPASATGQALEALCSLTGTSRQRSAPSRARAMMTLEAKAKLAKGSRVCTASGHTFKVTAEIINHENSTIDVEADLVAEVHGPAIAHADSLGEIKEPSTGWRKAVFKETYVIGNLLETDDELRLRRMNELRAAGASTIDAIHDRLKKLSGVRAVYIKEGSHNFEAIVMGGNDQEIAKTLWLRRPIGVETTGNVTCIIEDSIKVAREVRFSRPTDVPLKLAAELKVRRELDEAELNQLKNAIADFASQHFTLGSEVYPSQFYAVMLKNSLVLDVASMLILPKTPDAVPSEIKPEQIASLSIDDITITQKKEASL